MTDDRVTTQITNERLTLLYEISQTFNSSLDLDMVLNNVIDAIIDATNAEHGFVILINDNGDLEFRAARGVNQTTIDDPQLQISRGVIEGVIREGGPVLTQDAQVDSRFSGMQSVSILGLMSIMCAPLRVRGDILGAVYVENRIQAGIFTNDDLDLLNSIASSAAIAIENARLYQVAVEKGRMERELQVARNVQMSFIPTDICQPEGWEIGTFLSPAREVGGDFYDVFTLERSQRIGLVLGDVCDKGVGAAMFMALFRSLIRAYVEQHACMDHMQKFHIVVDEREAQEPHYESLESITSDVAALYDAVLLTNNYIATIHGHTNMFATVFFGILDVETGTLVYINGGHEPPVIVNNQGLKDRLMPTGPALGLFPDVDFEVKRTVLEKGDRFLVFTDGVGDALNEQGESFTEERLLGLIQAPALSLTDLMERIKTNLFAHIGKGKQYDDITLLGAWRKAE
jgi:sigma-B regulation protein RsbU (phosphoserine phosphatase)